MAKESVKRIGDKMLMEDREVETVSSGGAADKEDNAKDKDDAGGKTVNGKGGKTSNGFGKENGDTNGKAVSDISHMIKKKRKPEDVSADGDASAEKDGPTDAKKAHLETAA